MARDQSPLLGKGDIKYVSEWLEENKSSIPDRAYNLLTQLIKLNAAVKHLKSKFADMVDLLAKQMGMTPKSEKGRPSKRWFGV